MTVSILLACYNGKKFLREQLDSILNQDFQNFILYISDDGSSDGTGKIISEYSAKDKRIKVFPKHEPNKSACKHFLYMLENVEKVVGNTIHELEQCMNIVRNNRNELK